VFVLFFVTISIECLTAIRAANIDAIAEIANALCLNVLTAYSDVCVSYTPLQTALRVLNTVTTKA